MTQMFLDNTAYVGDGDGDVGRFDVLEIEMVAVDTSTRVLEFPWKNRSRLNSDTLRHSCKAAMLQDLRKKKKKNNGNLREKTKSTTDLSNIARSCSPFVCIWRRGDNGQLDLRALASGPGHMSVRGRILAAKHGQESLRDLNRFCSNLLMTITTNLCMLRD